MIRLTLALLLAGAAYGAEFFSGQAARAVLGQPSFSAHESGLAVSAMSLEDGRLYVADNSGRVSIFDLSRLPGPKDAVPHGPADVCPLCSLAPVGSISQVVAAGSSTVSAFGNRLAAIDTRTHRILIWHDVTSAAANAGPDVTLSLSDPRSGSANESTIVDPISVAVDGTHLFVGDAALHRVLVWKSLPTVDNQPADAVLGQPDFSFREPNDTPRPDTIFRPDALVSDGMNLFVGDSHDRRVLLFSAADSFLPSDSLLNSATLTTGSFAPGTLLTIRATALAEANVSAPDDRPTPLPTKLGGTEVLLNGVLLPLLSVSRNEVRAQLPYTQTATGYGSLYVRSERADGSVTLTSPASVAFATSSPGIFAFTGPEPRAGILLHGDDSAEGGSPVTAEAPASPGEVVTVWVTGLHPVTSSSDQMPVAGIPYAGGELSFTPVHAQVNGQPAEVLSTTLPQTSIGVYQVRLVLPRLVNRDRAELAIVEDGYSSNLVTFSSGKAKL
jgi:uncharacterized protein (TIGR03437 family)